MQDSYQFSVTKTKDGTYHIVVQDYKEIIRSYPVTSKTIERKLIEELNALRPVE